MTWVDYAQYDDPDDLEQSTIVLGTLRSPGVVTLSGHDRIKNWDVKKAKGQVGASSSLNGDDVGSFQASFYLADGYDFEKWDEFQRLIESLTNGPAPVALPIYHPDLARNHFTEVSNAGVGGMTYDGRGGRTVVVKFLEYKPPRPKPSAKAVAKPAGRTAAGGGGQFGPPLPPKPDPNEDAKRELAELVAEARKP
jgi:hypothetical protein